MIYVYFRTKRTQMDNSQKLELLFLSHNLQDGVSGGRGDSAHITIVPPHKDVTVVTPAGTPRVLDGPVRSAGRVGAITSAQDGVVDGGGRASGAGVDTARVQLEADTASVDGDTDGADLGDSGLEVGLGLFLGGTAGAEAADRVGGVG